MNLENASNNYQIRLYAAIVGLLTTVTNSHAISDTLENLDLNMPEDAYVRPVSDFDLVEERLELFNASNSENHETFFVDSMISKFDVLYQYENPPFDDIQYTEVFIKSFASYIDFDIHHLDMEVINTALIKIDEDDYISMKWNKSDRTLYFEVKNRSIYFTKLWSENNRLISVDGILVEEDYEEIWEWLVNGN